MGKQSDAERIVIASAATWREWLMEYADTSTGVWVLMPRSVGRGELYEPLVEEALCFGWIDSTTGSDPEHSHLWFAPRTARSMWARSNKDRVERLIRDGRMTARGQQLIDEAKANGMWTVLEGPEAGIEPAELTAALDANPAARATWDAYSPSARKFQLTQIALAKAPETVTRRIAAVVALAAEGKRPT